MSQQTAHLLSIGEYLHVYNRGVDRKRIFFEEENYEFFLRRIEKYLDPSKLTLLVFCLMPNHFHFVLRQDQPTLCLSSWATSASRTPRLSTIV